MRSCHRILALISCSMLFVAATGPAAVADLTWSGTGDGHSWNDAANWNSGAGPAPEYYDTLHITTTGGIDNVYRDTGTSIYVDGYTWRGIVNLNQGTINMTARFESGNSGVFNIGDGILTGGAPDAIVNVSSAGWRMDRHGDGTYTINVQEDGQLSGTFLNYGGHANRKWVINVAGGSMTSTSAWNMSDGVGYDANQVNLSKGGTVNVGAITVDEEVVHFQDASSASFTAAYGASFAEISAVNAAIGSRFTPSSGRTLTATDNGTSFTVAVTPETIEVGGDNTIGELHLTGTQGNEVYTSATGRFVQVKNNGTDTRRMDIGEIEVFAAGDTPTVDDAAGSGSLNPSIDLAYTANGASNYDQGADSGFSQPHGSNTDGPINAQEDVAGATWSSNGVGNYITIDLGATFEIATVRVHERNDGCCQDRLQNFSVNVFADDGTGNPGALSATTSYPGQPGYNLFGELTVGSLVSADLVASLNEIDTYVFEIGSSDQIIVDNPDSAVFTTILDVNDATIAVELLGAPQAGTWQLLVADEIVGSYDSLILPDLGSGWTWDYSGLLINGTLALVPEPSTCALILSGILALAVAGWRRRSR